MTLKQKQALLAYLGAYDGPLDGMMGITKEEFDIIKGFYEDFNP